MTFGDSIGTGVITLTGGISLSGQGSGRNVNTAADVIVTGVLSGGNSSYLTKSGSATLTLSNVAGTVNGASNIIITAGTLPSLVWQIAHQLKYRPHDGRK